MLGDRYDAHRLQDGAGANGHGAASMAIGHGAGGTPTHESIYHICGAGSVRLVQPQPGKALGNVYTDTLQCKYFTVLDEHTGCGHTILLIVDEEALQTRAALNNTVSSIVRKNIYGDALLVCVHEVGDDGDDEHLADFKDFYKAMGEHVNKCAEYVSNYRQLSTQQRALELLLLFQV